MGIVYRFGIPAQRYWLSGKKRMRAAWRGRGEARRGAANFRPVPKAGQGLQDQGGQIAVFSKRRRVRTERAECCAGCVDLQAETAIPERVSMAGDGGRAGRRLPRQQPAAELAGFLHPHAAKRGGAQRFGQGGD